MPNEPASFSIRKNEIEVVAHKTFFAYRRYVAYGNKPETKCQPKAANVVAAQRNSAPLGA